MAKATVTGKVISVTRKDYAFEYARLGDTVTITLEKGMMVIGKRTNCQFYERRKTGAKDWMICNHYNKAGVHSIHKMFCPCHRWKARKK